MSGHIDILHTYLLSDGDHLQNTLAVIGLIQPVGSIMPISEMQCRVFCEVISRRATLPNANKMQKNIDKKRQEMAKEFIPRRRHTIQVDAHNPFTGQKRDRMKDARHSRSLILSAASFSLSSSHLLFILQSIAKQISFTLRLIISQIYSINPSIKLLGTSRRFMTL